MKAGELRRIRKNIPLHLIDHGRQSSGILQITILGDAMIFGRSISARIGGTGARIPLGTVIGH
jgi:hypothetical protein